MEPIQEMVDEMIEKIDSQKADRKKQFRLEDYHGQKITRSLAIRLRCLDCTGNQKAEVRYCPAFSCPLWSFRMRGGYEPLPKKALFELGWSGEESC